MTESSNVARTSAEPTNQHVSSPRFGFVRAIWELPRVLLVLTLGRLLFIPVIIASLFASPIATATVLAIFIVADLYDGVLARDLGADDPTRRILDSLVDRVSIWSVYLAATLTGLLPLALLVILLARDLYCGYLCQRIIRSRNVVIRADWMYRSLNLMLAGWVVAAPLMQSQARAGVFASVLVWSAVVAMDLRRSVGFILAMHSSVVSAVIPAGETRRMRRSAGAERSLPAGPLLHSA